MARRAGVSTATVSHALHGKGRISEPTRERIRAVAASMGYQPNAAAQRLAGGRVGLLAVAFSLAGELPVRLTDVDYFQQAVNAATERALAHDYALVVAPPARHTPLWSRLPVDGVVVFDPVAGDPVLAELRARRVPIVLSGRDPAGGADYCVDNDHVAGTRSVLDHLAERGAGRVALLAGDLGDAFTADCVAAYRAWCAERGAEPQVTLVPFGHLADPDQADRLLAQAERPDAIYANVEILGVTALNAAIRRGLDVPGDLLLAVASDRGPADAGVPLTTLSLDPARTAAEAVGVLIELIEGRPPDDRTRLIATRLVPRASTAGLQEPRPSDG